MKKIIIIILCLFSLSVFSQRRVDSTVQVILPAKNKIPTVDTIPKSNKLDMFIDTWIGTPYRYGGTSMKGIDCSAFVQKMYEDVFGLFIPRTAQKQYKASTKVSKDEMSVGDLLFFMSGSSPSGWHVAVYLGNKLYMHAANKRTGVVTNELTQSTIKRIYAVGRFNKPIFDMYFYLRNLKS